MANRSYLYSSNVVPSPEVDEGDRRMNGISEWNYDIPVVFKILLSGNPRKCRSSIWDVPEEIAIAGEYDLGVDRLFRVLDRLSIPEITPLKDEARRFLTDDANTNRYFLLECGEIFELDDEPIDEQNSRLLAELQNIEPVVASVLADLLPKQRSKPKSGGFFSRLLGGKRSQPEKERSKDVIQSLGLGNWSNILYFDLRKPQ